MSLHNNENEKESTLIIELSKESALYKANNSLDGLKSSILDEFKKAKGIDKVIVGLNAAKVVSAESFLKYGEEGYRIVISFKSKDPDVISHQIIKSMTKLTFSAYGAYTGAALGGALNLIPQTRLLGKIAPHAPASVSLVEFITSGTLAIAIRE